MKTILNTIKSEKFGHALGTFLVLAFVFGLYFFGNTIEFHSFH